MNMVVIIDVNMTIIDVNMISIDVNMIVDRMQS